MPSTTTAFFFDAPNLKPEAVLDDKNGLACSDQLPAAQPATAVVAAPATTTADESLAQRLDRLSEAGRLADAALARAKAAAAERGVSAFADLPTSALPDVPWFEDDDHAGDDDDHGWDREHESGDREDD